MSRYPRIEVVIPELGPGERLCLITEERLGHEACQRIRRAWPASQAAGKVVVLDAGLRLVVQPANTASLNADYSARFGDTA
jgi:hypothetical protein